MGESIAVAENVKAVKERIALAAASFGRAPEDIVLVAASKTKDARLIGLAAQAGVSVFGENRVQEMLEKNARGAYEGVGLHFIGHLQKNKVKQVVGLCSLIQSADSEELLRLIDRRAAFLGIIQDVLIEINIAGEESKSGIAPEELSHILEAVSVLSGVRVRGLMAIPPVSLEKGSNRGLFAGMYKLFIDNWAEKYDNVHMDFLSMGMSGDFEDAIAEGANMVRIGSAIFGER